MNENKNSLDKLIFFLKIKISKKLLTKSKHNHFPVNPLVTLGVDLHQAISCWKIARQFGTGFPRNRPAAIFIRSN